MFHAIALGAVVFALVVAGHASRTRADAVADFYRGRTLQMVVGHEAGTGFDFYGRALARHIGRHIPGHPTLVPQNMVGAVGLVAANWLYNVAPKDGTVMAIFAHTAPLEPLLGQGAGKFDAQRFTWIGNMDEAVGVCGVWHATGITTFEQLATREVLVGASGSGTAGPFSQSPTALKNLFGARFRLVQGYKGSAEMKLAMLRGEVEGICGLPLSTLRSEWKELWAGGEYRLLLQLSRTRHPALAQVPHVFDLARTPEERQTLDLVFGVQALGRPIAAPPGLPPERAAALRRAFMATMQDPVFLAEARDIQLDLAPISGEALTDLIAQFYASPRTIVERARKAIRPAP